MLVGVPEKNSKAVFELAWSTYLEVGSGSGWQFWAAGRSCASPSRSSASKQRQTCITVFVSEGDFLVESMSTPTVQNLEEAATIASEFISSKFLDNFHCN